MRTARGALAAASERVFVALGANLGDRAAYIQRSLAEMARFATIVDTSFLYQSEPYVHRVW